MVSGGSGTGIGMHDADVSGAARCVRPHLRCLHWCGFCRLPPGVHLLLKSLHDFYCFFALAACCVYLVQECVYAYQERTDMDKLSRVMFLLLCHVTSVAKQLKFQTDAARIDSLLASFDEPVLNPASGSAALLSTAASARRLQRAYSGTAICTCVLWIVFPVARYARAQPVEFAFWLPAEPVHPLAFVLVLLYSFYVTTLVGIANTTMDAFIGTILYQCTTQMKILRSHIENLTERSRDACKTGGEHFEDAQLRLFRDSLVHYNKISEIKNLLEDIFGGPILIQFGIGGWILCMAAYKMVSLSVMSVEFASMNLFIVCILTELFVYCYYGNELTYESSRLLESLYACGWENASVAAGGEAAGRRRRLLAALLVAGERARRPLRTAAAGLVPLSLETFLKILKSSYTFYAVLRQTK